ncbi:unnamed protein product [Caenorhabditis sp. 36 PRJEB53466]|nr:unnamed protein product [Caenorhabditis sp. 36 PRJEB53466]
MIFFLIFVVFLCTSTIFAQEEAINAYESIKRLKECIEIVERPETRTACRGKDGIEKDECIEKFTQKMMPILNACIERSRKAIRHSNRDEL